MPPFPCRFPDDVTLQLFQIIAAQRITGVQRKEVVDLDDIVNLIQTLSLKHPAVERLSGIAVALDILAQRLAAGARLCNMLSGFDLLDVHAVHQPTADDVDGFEQLPGAGLHNYPALNAS